MSVQVEFIELEVELSYIRVHIFHIESINLSFIILVQVELIKLQAGFSYIRVHLFHAKNTNPSFIISVQIDLNELGVFLSYSTPNPTQHAKNQHELHNVSSSRAHRVGSRIKLHSSSYIPS